MEANNISRLREEQQKAFMETEDQLKQFDKYKKDYQALQTRLRTLPDQVTHDIMVPFGKLAFMPGKLVHTNEILVLLGDNWFVERSAKQAREIAGRRIAELDTRLKELKEQQKLLGSRLGFTSELQAVAEGQGDYKEIVEEYDEEKEKLWDEKHKANLRRHHQRQKKERASAAATTAAKNQPESDHTQRESESQGVGGDGGSSTKPAVTVTDDKDVWARLEALERLEDERGEMNSSFEEEPEDINTNDRLKALPTNEHPQHANDNISPSHSSSSALNQSKKVVWGDERGEAYSNRSDSTQQDSDDDEEEEDEEYEENEEDEDDDAVGTRSRSVVKKTITFSHTKPSLVSRPITELSEEDEDEEEEEDSNKVKSNIIITNPGEIYKLYSPRPILRKEKDPSSSKSSSLLSSSSLSSASQSSSSSNSNPSKRSVSFPMGPSGDNNCVEKKKSVSYSHSDDDTNVQQGSGYSYSSGRIKDKMNPGVGVENSGHTVQASPRDKAFSGIVKENPSVTSSLTGKDGSAPPSTKRVSKFKAQRMGVDNS